MEGPGLLQSPAMSQMISGVIFDFDGVLVDSEPVHEACLRDTVREVGMDFDSDFFHNRLIGVGDRACYPMIGEHNGRELSRDEIHRLMETKRRRFLDAVGRGDIQTQEGAVELLHSLALRVPVGLCSGSRRAEVLPVLEHIGVLSALTTIVTADDVEEQKPQPGPYLSAAKKIGREPSDCAAIEDTPTGLRSALGAGLRAFAVCHTKPREALDGAHVIVDRIGELTADRVLSGA